MDRPDASGDEFGGRVAGRVVEGWEADVCCTDSEELDDAHEGEGGCSLSWRGGRWVKVVDFAPPVATVVEEEMVKSPHQIQSIVILILF